ncbi:hypothetical protein [Nocardia transvalensis]|uniref:hypothetical protein n=1 Tax=Nocardia transvalensis TaxID=37333 RepID=UPI001895526D|nr:hypothetical protein [Nocardia transvalensis]MBF6333155.1 hypothetical protein [Nocardia transvalensis]
MPAADALFDLPAPSHDAVVPICWSYGMGAESTAGVVRSLLEPGFGPPELLEDFSNLIVMTAQTGDEWASTCELVTRFVLPILTDHHVRMVEVARAGPAVEDGIVVLQDTREPVRLHPDPDKDGFFSLSRENRRNGVMPQLGGTRKCSIKAKGWPLDNWRARELGSDPYLHAVGYNIEEGGRILTDSAVQFGGRRRPFYPIHESGWTRQQCRQYLYDLFGVWWPKSLCRQCCFVSRDEWPEQLARFNAAPAEGVHHLIDEYMAVALNRHAGLFGRAGTLAARLERDAAVEVLQLAEQELATIEWALYRVRRCYLAPAQAWRSVEIAHRGDRDTERQLLHRLARGLGREPVTEAGHTRLWLAHRTSDRYPHVESFYVAAPAEVRPKQRTGFELRFAAHVTNELLELDIAAADLVRALTDHPPAASPSSKSGPIRIAPQPTRTETST